MNEVTLIGIDLAKHHFQLHGSHADGSVAFRKALTRAKLLGFLKKQPPCLVAMEACGGAHHWAREIRSLGHRVRLMAPNYVKPYVKRQKNDQADAEAVAEAASRPTMRCVTVKTRAQQARSLLFRTRDLWVRQRTQTINALRGLLAEFGVVAPLGRAQVKTLEAVLSDADDARLDELVRKMGNALLAQIHPLDAQIGELDQTAQAAAREDDVIQRLRTIPGVGPITGLAFIAFTPDMEDFRCGRDFAAWLGLVPKQHSSGGKARLGKVSKRGQRDLRRLLITGAMSVIRHQGRGGKTPDPWLQRLMVRKPTIQAGIALANKMARTLWALIMKGEDYRVRAAQPVGAGA